MTLSNATVAIALFLLAGCSGLPAPALPSPTPAGSAVSTPNSTVTSKPGVTVQLPPVPAFVPVTLNASTTAIIVNDVNTQICKPRPQCTEGMVPKIALLLAQARKAGALVVYTGDTPILPEVAPAPGEQTLSGAGQDRFFNTNLDNLLKSKGTKTVDVVGWRSNGSVLYTAVGAGLRGYTVVVPDDTTSAAQDYDIAVGRYQMLTQLNSNPRNEPLKANAVTLSRTDLITIQ